MVLQEFVDRQVPLEIQDHQGQVVLEEMQGLKVKVDHLDHLGRLEIMGHQVLKDSLDNQDLLVLQVHLVLAACKALLDLGVQQETQGQQEE